MKLTTRIIQWLILAAIFCVVLVSVAAAQLDAPEKVEAGTFVSLKAIDVPGEHKVWIVPRLLPDESYAIDSSGHVLYFATSVQGVYEFALVVTEVTISDEGTPDISQIVIRHTVTVGKPTPRPNPDPDPEPELRERLGLASLARDTCRETGDRGTADRMAGIWRSVAAAIAAGAANGKEEILEITIGELQEFADEFEKDSRERTAWRAWSNRVFPAFEALEADGKLKTDDDYHDAWAEIALGLEVVASQSKVREVVPREIKGGDDDA